MIQVILSKLTQATALSVFRQLFLIYRDLCVSLKCNRIAVCDVFQSPIASESSLQGIRAISKIITTYLFNLFYLGNHGWIDTWRITLQNCWVEGSGVYR